MDSRTVKTASKVADRILPQAHTACANRLTLPVRTRQMSDYGHSRAYYSILHLGAYHQTSQQRPIL